MNVGRILQRFKEHYAHGSGIRSSSTQARKLMKQYQSVPLTLPISDEPMKRVCEVLTRAGYTTIESCEGHQRNIPQIWLECASQYHLRHLTNILSRESRETTFPWDLRTSAADVLLNSEHPLRYIMGPNLAFLDARPQNNVDYHNMIDDLDIIGIAVLRYFSSVDLRDVERNRKKLDSRAKSFTIPDVPTDFFR